MNIFTLFSKIKEKIKPLFLNKKKSLILVSAIIVALVLFFIPSILKKQNNESQSPKIEDVSVSEYSKNVEEKLESMLLKISEINSASVMVMIESTPQIQYLTETEETLETDEKGGSSSIKSTTVVFEKDGSVSTPVVVTTVMPKVTGVLIVLNKISASTKLSIINSISVVLNIDASCISILQES